MISFDTALETVLKSARPLPSESVAIHDALNRVLASDITSDIDMPPFRKSAMDGYACRRADLHATLDLIETIPAGREPTRTIGQNQCAKIMTGAMVPEGADCVFMVEFSDERDGNVRFTGESVADHICEKGEDIQKGDILLRQGQLLKPQHLAILATVGCTQPLVARRPRVGVIATGNELVDPAEKPRASQIRNSNSHQLMAQIVRCGGLPHDCGIARDTEKSLQTALTSAISQSDVVLLSAGVSAGDFDLVPDLLRKNDVALLFEKIAIKPGRPTLFGVRDTTYFFGIPGNPVSTFVVFELLIRPFLLKLMGHDYRPLTVKLPMGHDTSMGKTERQSFMPIAIRDGAAFSLNYHGPAHMNALTDADGLLAVPKGTTEITKGKFVDVRQI